MSPVDAMRLGFLVGARWAAEGNVRRPLLEVAGEHYMRGFDAGVEALWEASDRYTRLLRAESESKARRAARG